MEGTGDADAASLTLFEGSVRRPGQGNMCISNGSPLRSSFQLGETADVATVIRNWWAYPAAGKPRAPRNTSWAEAFVGSQVGFGASLELPVQKFEVLDAEKTELGRPAPIYMYWADDIDIYIYIYIFFF